MCEFCRYESGSLDKILRIEKKGGAGVKLPRPLLPCIFEKGCFRVQKPLLSKKEMPQSQQVLIIQEKTGHSSILGDRNDR